MWQLISDYNVEILDDSEEVKFVALYIKEEAVTSVSETDAAYIAITALNGLGFIVSLYFGHIAKAWAIKRVRRVNI